MCISSPMGYPDDTMHSLTGPKSSLKDFRLAWSAYSSSTSSSALLRMSIISRSLKSV